ncbi:hypothetical protein IAE19_11220 [Acinetobacter sp. S40]|uniref:hypothetical protein n=1 Tax=unclassified Acinetobacter TaxID=196816 RepID=UPI00190D63D9|nr:MULTISPECIES: hypothetical protein [unclassified Acinetobacter]MBJ9986005.1 hypothetical protein [Acinetobacter sp. S40]MBK0063922.1 hypothetical protein [Acinetobacter sp. S55]MBK0067207.1 hypothetical protein [Acinetobacter sp. S54]
MQKILLSLAFLISLQSHAALEQLNNTELQKIEGQAGADLSLKVTLNQTSTGQFDSTLCSDLRYCRLALNFNNRGTEAAGNRQWLVFKGVQGTINIQKLGLDGVDLQYNNKSGVGVVKPAIQLGAKYDSPILFRNFGFDTMSIETDNGTGDDKAGYLANTSGGTANVNSYSNGIYTVSGYDNGREVGFTGMKLTGNLALNGKVMIFSCDSTHPRC